MDKRHANDAYIHIVINALDPIMAKDIPAKLLASRDEWVSRVCSESGFPEPRVETLLSRYGTNAEQISGYLTSTQDQALKQYPDLSTREIEYIVQQEDVFHVDDFLLRRSMLGMLGRSSKKGLDELGQVIGGDRGWNDQLIKEEVERTVEILKSKHRIVFDHSRSEGEE